MTSKTEMHIRESDERMLCIRVLIQVYTCSHWSRFQKYHIDLNLCCHVQSPQFQVSSDINVTYWLLCVYVTLLVHYFCMRAYTFFRIKFEHVVWTLIAHPLKCVLTLLPTWNRTDCREPMYWLIVCIKVTAWYILYCIKWRMMFNTSANVDLDFMVCYPHMWCDQAKWVKTCRYWL